MDRCPLAFRQARAPPEAAALSSSSHLTGGHLSRALRRPPPTRAAASDPAHAMLGLDMRVLIVEDEVKMAGLLRRGLREEGLAADVASAGEDALWMATSTPYDAIVLDVM